MSLTCLTGSEHFSFVEAVGPTKNGKEDLRQFVWCPTSPTDDFAFVYENNIWYQGKPGIAPFQITTTGSVAQNVFNGVADWLYEEEIFGSDVAMWWSKSGSRLAYMTSNDSFVRQINYDFYDPTNIYPQIKSIPYPKAGEAIPGVSLHIWNKLDNRTVDLVPPAAVLNLGDFYIISVTWLPRLDTLPMTEPLVVVWSNRNQTKIFITICKHEDGECVLNYQSDELTELWYEPDQLRIQAATNQSYFVILPRKVGNSGIYYHHLAQVSVPAGIVNGAYSFLTDGPWEVTEVSGYDPLRQRVYFIAAQPVPRQRNLYSVPLSAVMETDPYCLTCWMSTPYNCSYVSASFSTDGDHHILYCQGPGVPTTFLRSAVSNQTLLLVENNSALKTFIYEKKAMPVVRDQIVELDGNINATVRFLLPPGFNENVVEETYPLVLRVYAGPNSQQVLDRFGVSYDTYLASQKRYIVAYIDARGSGARGSAYLTPIYRKLGTAEITDQLATIQKLEETSHFIEKNRMAVWGWSYGGFATAHILEQDRKGIFKCGTSVAPVTNFRYYDAAYTERYMGLPTPDDNLKGYEATDVTKNVTALKNVKYLLVHGTGDDNVHFQNSAIFVAALTANNVQFDLMIYPNEQHALAGDRPHLYTMLDQFWENCFLASG